ncbi:hypothetical protein AJ81_06580 [Pseudothermotoga hypogea DSM 11164 = NBRC 106472]|uniref:Uncharacterized protein n=2 Tax=Thermotogaceae TaxID=188709 RepID=A0A0X1KRV8_9THEM|nr:DUF6512 family protein [Pseudothermotoga hypogea]AJC73914.1 hypothetical protein AJ81_06580 [Pseudothermotoga hypogea DSM 11164 = NBRC 106472]MBC7123002.1 hypothetical protein [Pseudothermotoga sp.]
MVLFSVLHFGHELTGWDFLKIFCGTDESVFEHIKMGFWAYLFTSAIEFFVFKKKQNFWSSRLFSTSLVPWFIVVVWYMVPAIFGKIEAVWIELIWAFAIVIISGLFATVVERQVETLKISKGFKTVMVVLVAVSIIFFVRFSFAKPWIDVFVDPYTL